MTKTAFTNGQILVDPVGRYHAFQQYKNATMIRGIFHNLPGSHDLKGFRPTNVTDPVTHAFLYMAVGTPCFVTRGQLIKASNTAILCAAIGAMAATGVKTIIWQDFELNNTVDLDFRSQLIRTNAELGFPEIKIASGLTTNTQEMVKK